MKRYIKKMSVAIFAVTLVQVAQSYNKERIVLGQAEPFAGKKTYVVHHVENGNWVQDAVMLSAQEKNALQRLIKIHIVSESDFNKRIDSEAINTILSGCKRGRRNSCNLIGQVLNDFVGRSFTEMFTAIGLSRDI